MYGFCFINSCVLLFLFPGKMCLYHRCSCCTSSLKHIALYNQEQLVWMNKSKTVLLILKIALQRVKEGKTYKASRMSCDNCPDSKRMIDYAL